MPKSYFQFKQFTIYQDQCAMKVTTDGCLFGAWVAKQIGDRTKQQEKFSLLDIGAGTGLLSLMIAQQSPVSIDAIEIDAAAGMQAASNINDSPWKQQIKLIVADIREWDPGKEYDFIVSNPPFYENELSSPDPGRKLAHHGDSLLLEELISKTTMLLKTGGSFFFMIPFKRLEAALSLLEKNELHIYQQVMVRQTTSHYFFRVLLEVGNIERPGDTMQIELAIKNNQKEYTLQFKDLLTEYYLHL